MDANEVINQVGQVATTENLGMAAQTGQDILSLILKLLSDAFSLVTQNMWWGIAIVGLVILENAAIDHFSLPLPSGKIRYALLFLATMFFAWIWQPLFAGWIH